MGIVLNTNTASLFAKRALSHASDKTVRTTEKLSTGHRINRAGDDAAGTSINTKIHTRLRGLNSAQRNIQNAIDVVNHTQTGLLKASDEIQAIRELTVQAYNTSTYSEDELSMIQREINSRINNIQIMRDESSTKINGFGADVFRGTEVTGYEEEFQVGTSSFDITTLDFTDNNNVDNTIELGTDLNVPGSLSEGASDVLANFNIGSNNVSSYSGTVTGRNGSLEDLDTMLENLSRMIAVTEGYRVDLSASFEVTETEKLAFNKQREHYEGTDYSKTGAEHFMNELRMQSASSVLTQANSLNNVALNLLP